MAIPEISAFPNIGNANWSLDPERGITIRDYFAAKALPAMMASFGCDISKTDRISRLAYQFADAMMAARKTEAE
jgi:hypothetical protein